MIVNQSESHICLFQSLFAGMKRIDEGDETVRIHKLADPCFTGPWLS